MNADIHIGVAVLLAIAELGAWHVARRAAVDHQCRSIDEPCFISDTPHHQVISIEDRAKSA